MAEFESRSVQTTCAIQLPCCVTAIDNLIVLAVVAVILVVYFSVQCSARTDPQCSQPQHRFQFRCFVQEFSFTPRRPQPPRPTFRSFNSRFRSLTPLQRLRISIRPPGRTRFGRINRRPTHAPGRDIRPVHVPANFRPGAFSSTNVRSTRVPNFRPTPTRRVVVTQAPLTRPRPTFRQAPAPFRAPVTRSPPVNRRTPVTRARPSFRQAPAPFRSPVTRSPPVNRRTPVTRARPSFRQAPAPFRSPVTRSPPVNRRTPVTRARPSFRQAPAPFRSPVTGSPPVSRRTPMTQSRLSLRQVQAPVRAPVTRRPVVAQTVSILQQRLGTQQTNGAAISGIRAELQGMLQQSTARIASWVQLGFHACVGGCDGCLDLTNHHNRGLGTAYRDIRDLQLKHATNITLADLVTLAAVEAGNEGLRAASNSEANIPFRIGRRTCSNPDNPQKRSLFPEGDNPNAIVLLMSEFRLQRSEAIALLGAHSLGRCRGENSGFQGPWDNTPNALDNGYYRSLQGTEWVTAVSPGGKIQWTANRDNLNSRMMLTADMGIFKQFTVRGNTSEPSCATMSTCPDSPDVQRISTYASNERTFHQDFTNAYVKMLEKSTDALTSP